MKSKRLLSLALAVSMAFSMLILPANAASFTDTKYHWAEQLIEQAVAHGYVPAGGAFEPNRAITRNEFARMVNGAFGLTAVANLSFTDVPTSDPYYKDVQKAVSAGYIAGYEDNTFKGTNLITRQEAAVIIARLVAHPGTLKEITTLKDTASIAAWALPAAKIAYTKGYMVGDNLQNFNPLGNLTRAETVKILECILDGETIISENVTVKTKNSTLSGKIYTGSLIISDAIESSSVQLTNCKVLGTLLVNGGSESGIRLSNTGVANLTVDSQWTNVGVAAVGDSTVYNTYLKTASQLVESNLSGMGAGFKNVTLGGAANKVSLSGTTYDKVSLNVPSALSLASGKITNLNIAAAAAGTSVRLSAGTNVETADIQASAAFTGTGTITKADTHGQNVTFETQPGAPGDTDVTDTPDNTGTSASGYLGYTATPANGAAKVDTAVKLTLSFEDAITPAGGQSLSISWVRSNVTLLKNAATPITYSPSISKDGKTLTLDPDAELEENTEYLLIVNAGAIKGKTNGLVNTAIAVRFTTKGEETSAPVVSAELEPTETSPKNKATEVDPSSDIKIHFDVNLYTAEDEKATGDYMEDIIEIRKNSQSGTKVTFDAAYSTSTDVITLDPKADLDEETTYYVILKAAALYDKDGNENEKFVFYFTTGSTYTEGLEVNIEVAETSAKLKIGYDYSDTDADKAYMTVKYRAKGASSWKTLSTCNKSALSSKMYGTKNVTLSGLSRNTSYEYQILVDLQEGSESIASDSTEGTFKLKTSATDDDYLIDVIRIYDEFSEKWLRAESFKEMDDGVIEITPPEAIEPVTRSGKSYVDIAICPVNVNNVFEVTVNGDDHVYEEDGYYEYRLDVDKDDRYVSVEIKIVDALDDEYYYVMKIELC